MNQTMIDLFRNIFGEYTPLTDANGNMLTGLASINFEYILTAACFILLLIFVCRAFIILLKGVLNVH